MEKLVIVFDFDKTLVDCDSDNWVVEQFDLTEIFTQLLPILPWNSLMDKMMMEIHSKRNEIDEIAECLKQIPMHPNIISAIKSAHAYGCDLRIASDANTFFIKTILESYGLMNCFSEIKTNPSYVDDEGRLRILPYHDFNSSSHGCTICPPNLCKGVMIGMMRNLISAEAKTRLVYVGDGTPDFCATLKLEEGDIVIARKNFPLWELINSKKDIVKADIEEWSDCEELGTKLINLINTIFNEDKSFVKPDPWLPIDCKFETASSSIAAHDTRKILPVPR